MAGWPGSPSVSASSLAPGRSPGPPSRPGTWRVEWGGPVSSGPCSRFHGRSRPHRPHPLGSDPTGFEVFGPRADTVLGALASLLTAGGVWNSDVVPPGRGTLVGGVASVLLVVWALLGFVVTRGARARSLDPRAAAYRVPVAVVGGAGLALGLVSTWPTLIESLAEVPGGGLLRDGSRQLGTWAFVIAVGAAWAVRWLALQRIPATVVWLVTMAPVAVLPSLGWGLAGLFQPVTYPLDVRLVAAVLGSAREPGSVAVLPFEAYRRYGWNDGTSSLTPWSRLVDRRVVASSDLVVLQPGGPTRVAGEDEYAAPSRARAPGGRPGPGARSVGSALAARRRRGRGPACWDVRRAAGVDGDPSPRRRGGRRGLAGTLRPSCPNRRRGRPGVGGDLPGCHVGDAPPAGLLGFRRGSPYHPVASDRASRQHANTQEHP